VKLTSPKVKRHLKQYLEEYKQGTSIQTLAKQANYPPYLFCRYIAEHVANLKKHGKKGLTQAMRDPMGELGNREIINEQFLDAEEKLPEDVR
jgi:hypothetical protein